MTMYDEDRELTAECEKVKQKECPKCGEPMSRATTFGSFDFHWYCPVSIGGCGYKEAPE